MNPAHPVTKTGDVFSLLNSKFLPSSMTSQSTTISAKNPTSFCPILLEISLILDFKSLKIVLNVGNSDKIKLMKRQH